MKTGLESLERSTFRNSPQADLAIFVSCGDAVIFWVTCDACKRVLASLLVAVFEEKPIKSKDFMSHVKNLSCV